VRAPPCLSRITPEYQPWGDCAPRPPVAARDCPSFFLGSGAVARSFNLTAYGGAGRRRGILGPPARRLRRPARCLGDRESSSQARLTVYEPCGSDLTNARRGPVAGRLLRPRAMISGPNAATYGDAGADDACPLLAARLRPALGSALSAPPRTWLHVSRRPKRTDFIGIRRFILRELVEASGHVAPSQRCQEALAELVASGLFNADLRLAARMLLFPAGPPHRPTEADALPALLLMGGCPAAGARPPRVRSASRRARPLPVESRRRRAALAVTASRRLRLLDAKAPWLPPWRDLLLVSIAG